MHAIRAVLLLTVLVRAHVSAQTSTSPPQTSPTPAHLAQMQMKLDDWAQLARYRDDNAHLAASTDRVVFYGDSITDAWGRNPGSAPFFPGKPYINRGISGQTTPQMLVRFEQDVVRLHPAAVVILAGTNDIAGNTGPETPEMIEDNFRAMAAIAQQDHIRVVFASILPVARYPWKPAIEPVTEIRQLNTWLKRFCAEQGLVYLDYYTALVDEHGGMRAGTAIDGVHPTAAGYAVMAPLAEQAIHTALSAQTHTRMVPASGSRKDSHPERHA